MALLAIPGSSRAADTTDEGGWGAEDTLDLYARQDEIGLDLDEIGEGLHQQDVDTAANEGRDLFGERHFGIRDGQSPDWLEARAEWADASGDITRITRDPSRDRGRRDVDLIDLAFEPEAR